MGSIQGPFGTEDRIDRSFPIEQGFVIERLVRKVAILIELTHRPNLFSKFMISRYGTTP